jgi:hypothetical protein
LIEAFENRRNRKRNKQHRSSYLRLKKEQTDAEQTEARGENNSNKFVENDGIESLTKEERILYDELNERLACNLRNGFEPSLVPKKIIGMTCQKETGQVMFLMEWKDKSELDLVPDSVARERFANAVIQFYEQRFSFL